MDINLVREAVLVIAIGAFCGIVWWAYGPSRRTRFERAAQSVLEEHDGGSAQHVDARHGVEGRKG